MIFAVPFGDGIRSGVGEIKGWKYDIPKSDFAIGMIDKKLQINEINVGNIKSQNQSGKPINLDQSLIIYTQPLFL